VIASQHALGYAPAVPGQGDVVTAG
jgi:hypothetical protein